MAVKLNRAIFLDKDGTLVHDLPYNVDPSRLRLRADAGAALARMQAAGYQLMLVSNQPGIAFGYFDECDLVPIWHELARHLAFDQVFLDAIYYCPHHPHGVDPRYTGPCHCRKPEPGMLLRAAAENQIDLAASWMIGDILDDIEAGRVAGCRTILLDVGSETEWRHSLQRHPHYIAADLSDAADYIVDATARVFNLGRRS